MRQVGGHKRLTSTKKKELKEKSMYLEDNRLCIQAALHQNRLNSIQSRSCPSWKVESKPGQ